MVLYSSKPKQLGFCLKRQLKNLLPGKVYNWVAQTYILSKIKPKVLPRSVRIEGFFRLKHIFSRLALILALALFLAGYYPVFAFPPIKRATALAEGVEQKQEIIAYSFPLPLVLPHPGYLSSKYSKWHPGVDIAAGLGMPIHPITAGTVEEINYGFWGLGHNVVVSHPNGFKSTYGHMGKIYVKKGQGVTSESTLGEVGLTGYTSGPHTHLEIQKDGNYLNPQDLLPEIPPLPQQTTSLRR